MLKDFFIMGYPQYKEFVLKFCMLLSDIIDYVYIFFIII
jgi:hypothetical protein